MKKLSFILASAALLSATFASCVQDTQPRIDKPTEFVLNTPPMSENSYILTENSDIEITWSQPNYGLGVTPNYYLQLSQYPEFKDGAGEDSYYEFTTAYTVAKANLKGEALARTLQEWLGWETEEAVPDEPVQLYMRIMSIIPNYAAGTIASNIVPFSVQSYFVLTDPDEIYLIGAPQGWNIANGDGWTLYETEIGSKLYKGVFDIPAGEFTFRFYDKLGNWEMYSIGAGDEDEDFDISMASGSYTGPVFYNPDVEKAGKGKWHDPDWAGGPLTITVDLKNLTVEFLAGAKANEIYIVGACNGWDINSDALHLTETANGSNIYAGTVNIPAGQFTFRFYSELGDWETHIIGSAEVAGDENFDITLPYDGACVAGDGNEFKGKWNYDAWAGGDVDMTVNLNDLTVSFAAAE